MANSIDDFEDALSIIEANDGLGEYEDDEEPMEVERWSFPRFPGADEIGTCRLGTKQALHTGEHKMNDKCKDFAPHPGNMYLSRPGIDGYESDVEMIADWAAAPRTEIGGIMLLGNPGTGKTAVIEAAATYAGATLLTHLCTPDDTRESLFLRFVGEGKGENGTPYTMGPMPTAAKMGYWFYMDEYPMLNDGAKPITYEFADGRRFLSGGNVDGSDLEIHPDFRFIVSGNPVVRGASLPEPIGSRFASTTLTIETSVSLLTDLGVEESVIAAWEALGTANLWRPEIRELRMADYWLARGRKQMAQAAFLPEHCPESQRQAVRDIVVGYLGESMRNDGRLVVS